MRPQVPAAAALATLAVLAALAPGAAAHEEDAVNHFTVTVDDLAPGATREVHATWEGGPLRAGWVLVLVGGVVGDETPLEVSLTLANETIESWTWTTGGGRVNFVTTALPKTSDGYVVRLTNRGDAEARFFFYFDQSCDCFAKPMPFPGAWAIFNFDFYGGDTVWFRFEDANGTLLAQDALAYRVYERTSGGGRFPDDFRELAGPDDLLPNGSMTWRVPEDATYYVFAQSQKLPQGTLVEPHFYAAPPDEGKGTPAPGLIAALAAVGLAAAVALTRPRARRGRPPF